MSDADSKKLLKKQLNLNYTRDSGSFDAEFNVVQSYHRATSNVDSNYMDNELQRTMNESRRGSYDKSGSYTSNSNNTTMKHNMIIEQQREFAMIFNRWKMYDQYVTFFALIGLVISIAHYESNFSHLKANYIAVDMGIGNLTDD